ncbi:DUF1294 domain-containing protein [Ruegeria sp. EL01]|jgi:uncharacterized membrane protein YsdA (DUF1294 family)|uniref:DUF1294 domain-containing protein n=1 Tax=Ruegeria sp. EL01 TaxID=2107578 RepID=UPI000EA7FDA5|nr:DUF1294 domain-containing protein [Ruegeria sp. EL01]
MWISVIYLWTINVLTLLAFGWDKARSRRRRRRVPERRLLWLAALGGSPAALLGRWMFQHKTRKRGFTMWVLGIFALQAAMIYVFVVSFPAK